MNVPESPLEALAFDYLSFGIFTIVNNLWTWVAVITAAVSFWRLKTAGAAATSFSPIPDLQQPSNDRNTSESESQPVTGISPAEPVVQPPPPTLSPSSSVPHPSSVCEVKDDGETKGKFMLYYHEEDRESDSDGELTVVKQWEDEYRDACEEWWERVMRLRMVDMDIEWHRYLDLTVINGNIVRFWDECNLRERRHGSVCAVW